MATDKNCVRCRNAAWILAERLVPSVGSGPLRMVPMDQAFDARGRRLLDALLTIDPVRASEMGSSDHDCELPSGGPERFLRRVEELESAARDLSVMDLARADPEQRLDLELLGQTACLERFMLEKGTFVLAGGDPALEVGAALDPLFSRESRPAEHRVDAMNARLSGVPRFLREARSRYLHPVRYWTLAAIRSCGATADYIREVEASIPSILRAQVAPDEVRSRVGSFSAAAESACLSLREFARFLESEMLERSSASLAMGTEAFAELIRIRRFGFGLEELSEIGWEAWHELGDRYDRELGELYPGVSRDQAETRWGESAAPSFEGVLGAYRTAVAESREFVTNVLGLVPPGAERLEVRPTPTYLESVIPSAAYFEPERFVSGSSLGIYMVTRPREGKDLAEHAPGMVYNTSCHEGYPGHHLQLCWANSNRSPIRALVSGDEFCEGWAHYAEEAMFDAGFRPVPGMQAAQVKDAMFRALRINVDIGLQTGELSPESAADLLVEKGRISRHRAVGEVGWYTFKPGYPLGYLTGKILIRQLRSSEEARLGPDFDLCDFHRSILAGGTMPVWAHRARLELVTDSPAGTLR